MILPLQVRDGVRLYHAALKLGLADDPERDQEEPQDLVRLSEEARRRYVEQAGAPVPGSTRHGQ
jgi:hypothetical protein